MAQRDGTTSFSHGVDISDGTNGGIWCNGTQIVDADGSVLSPTGATFTDITGSDSSLGITGQAAAQGGAVAITGGTSSTVANAGGAVTMTGGTGPASSAATAGAGGAATQTGGTAGTTATGTGGAGGASTVVGAAGGAASGNGTGGAGGAAGVTAGVGGAAAGTGAAAGGVGGAANLTAGAGGAAAGTSAGGVGGAITVQSGAGGAKTGTGNAAGGAAGALAITGGVGGATANSSAAAGGAGGTITVTAGAGGAASAGTGNGGAAGSVVLVPGIGGTSAGGTAGVDGGIFLRSTTGRIFKQQVAPGAGADQAETLTAAQMFNGIYVHTISTGRTLTTPTGAALSAACPADVATGDSFEFTLITVGTGADDIVTLTAGDGNVTFVGVVTVGPNIAGTDTASATWRFRKTGASTWVGYRLT